MLTDVWDLMDTLEWSVRDLSEHTKLSTSCIRALRHRITREPRASTLFKLAKSVGLRLFAEETQAPKILRINRA